jgi:hypothetical protein
MIISDAAGGNGPFYEPAEIGVKRNEEAWHLSGFHEEDEKMPGFSTVAV